MWQGTIWLPGNWKETRILLWRNHQVEQAQETMKLWIPIPEWAMDLALSKLRSQVVLLHLLYWKQSKQELTTADQHKKTKKVGSSISSITGEVYIWRLNTLMVNKSLKFWVLIVMTLTSIALRTKVMVNQ